MAQLGRKPLPKYTHKNLTLFQLMELAAMASVLGEGIQQLAKEGKKLQHENLELRVALKQRDLENEGLKKRADAIRNLDVGKIAREATLAFFKDGLQRVSAASTKAA